MEDMKNKDTVFLSVGERIGSAVLKSIDKDKVIFSDGGKPIELVP